MERPESSFLSRLFQKVRDVFVKDAPKKPQIPNDEPAVIPQRLDPPPADVEPIIPPKNEQPIEEEEFFAYPRAAVDASQFPRFVPTASQTNAGWTYGRGTLKGSAGFFLNNVALPDCKAAADVIYVTEKGIVLVEDTEVPGSIFAPEQSDLWVTTLAEGRFSFDNPLLALEKKTAALRTLLSSMFSQELPIFPFVSFPTGTDLSYLDVDTSIPVLTKGRLSSTLNTTLAALPDMLSREAAEDVWRALLPYMKKG